MASGWFSKGSASRSIVVGAVSICAGIGLISAVAGPEKTWVGTHTAARQFWIGTGIGSSTADEIVPGIMQGWNAGDGITLPNEPKI